MSDQRWFIDALEQAGEMVRIPAEVDWDLELGHIAKLNEERAGPALLFENVRGYRMPVLASMLTTTRRMALALRAPEGSTLCELARAWVGRTRRPVPPKVVSPLEAPVCANSIPEEEIDLLSLIPVPRLYPGDGGRYIGTAVSVVTKDPDSEWVNVGTYRGQVFDGRTLGLQPIKGKDADLHIQNARARGMERMPIALVFGYDPLLFLCSSTLFGRGIQEYEMVGALRGEPVALVEGKYSGLPVPAHAEVVVEGDLVINDLRKEGPFGEYTGYYSGQPTPKVWIDVKHVLLRDDPVFPITSVGRPVTDTHMIQALNRTATLWKDLEDMRLPGIKSVYFLPESGGRFIAIISVDQKYPGHAEQVGTAALGTSTGHYGVKYIILVDGDVQADDLPRVWWAIAMRSQPSRCEVIRRGRSTPLDPSLPIDQRYMTSKMIINACLPYEWEEKPELITLDEATVSAVRGRWSELGLSDAVPL